MSRITTGRMDPELESLASAYAMHPSIEAVVVSGSIGGALAAELSDFDIYVYSKNPVEVEFRESLLRPRAAKLNLHRTFWEDEEYPSYQPHAKAPKSSLHQSAYPLVS